MQDVFYEESATMQNTGAAKTKYYICKTISIISYVAAVLWLVLAISFFPLEGAILINILILAIPFAMFLTSGILIGKLKDKFYVDYDYTFVSGSIRFSKVIKNIKRKNIIVFDTKNIEKIGRYASTTFERYSKMPGIKQNVLTSNTEPENGKDFYYLVVNVGGQKYLFILECSETFLSNVLRFSNRTVFEDDFFNKNYGKK